VSTILWKISDPRHLHPIKTRACRCTPLVPTVKLRLNEANLFGRIANKKQFLWTDESKFGIFRYKRRTSAGSGSSPKWCLMQLDDDFACLWSQFYRHHFWWSCAAGRSGFYGMKMTWVWNFSEYSRHLS
jgi:hypothetical protein